MQTTTSTYKLPPMTAYYLRKLVAKHQHRLKFVVAEGAGLRADGLSNLDAVLHSLYLDDIEILTAINDLDRLAACHQALVEQRNSYSKEIEQLESEIFWVLGFKLT